MKDRHCMVSKSIALGTLGGRSLSTMFFAYCIEYKETNSTIVLDIGDRWSNSTGIFLFSSINYKSKFLDKKESPQYITGSNHVELKVQTTPQE